MNLNNFLKKYNWISSGDVLIPAYYGIYKRIESDKERFISFIPYSEIFSEKMSKRNIGKILREYNLQQALLFFSKIGLLLYNDGVLNSNLQLYLAKDHFDKTTFRKILQIENTSQKNTKSIRPIFTPQQILVLMKMAFLLKIDGKKEVDKKNIKEISILTLAVNDYLQMEKFGEEKASESEKDQQVFESLICNFELNTNERFKYLLTRYNILFFELFQSKPFKTLLPIDEFFKNATGGLDLETYFFLGFAILANFIRASRIRPSISDPSLNEGFFLMNTSTYFRKTKAGTGELKSIYREFSADIDYFVTQFDNRKKNSKLDSDYDFFPFICKPLIKLRDHYCILSSRRFLEEKITAGVYWLIHDYVRDNLPSRKYGDFKRIFGEVFETYIGGILKRIFPTGGPFLIKQVFTEKEYYKGKKPYKTSDIMIFYDNEAIFVEATTSQLRIDTVLSGRMSQFQKDLERIIIDKAKQLNRVISDYKQGCFTIPDFPAKTVKKIHPLLVTLKSLPVLPPLWRGIYKVWIGINAELKQKNYLQQSYCERLQIISAEELEMLEPLITTGVSLIDVLKRWANDSFFCDYQLKNFINYNYYRTENIENYDNQYLHNKYMKIVLTIKEKLLRDNEN